MAPNERTAPADTDGAPPMRSVSLLAVGNVLLRGRRLIVRLTAVAFVVAIAFGFLQPPAFVAESTFMPQDASGANAQFAGLASRLGFDIRPATGDALLSFYPELLLSRELLREAAAHRYEFPEHRFATDTLRGTLVELYEVEGETRDDRLRGAVERLKEDIFVEVNSAAGIISIEVSAPWPALAEQLNRRLLELVNEFNLVRRQSQAAAERRFIEGRLDEARQDLRSAEDALKDFYDQNRKFQMSPELSVEAARLERQVQFQQQVYTTLAQAYENARIEEVRNTPVITIIDGAEGSVHRANRWLVLRGVFGALLGFFVAAAVLLVREAMARQRVTNPTEFAEFERLAQGAVADLRRSRWFGWVRRWLPGRRRSSVVRPASDGD